MTARPASRGWSARLDRWSSRTRLGRWASESAQSSQWRSWVVLRASLLGLKVPPIGGFRPLLLIDSGAQAEVSAHIEEL